MNYWILERYLSLTTTRLQLEMQDFMEVYFSFQELWNDVDILEKVYLKNLKKLMEVRWAKS